MNSGPGFPKTPLSPLHRTVGLRSAKAGLTRLTGPFAEGSPCWATECRSRAMGKEPCLGGGRWVAGGLTLALGWFTWKSSRSRGMATVIHQERALPVGLKAQVRGSDLILAPLANVALTVGWQHWLRNWPGSHQGQSWSKSCVSC